MGVIARLNVCPKPPQIRLVFSQRVAGCPAPKKPTQGLHGAHGGLHLQVGTLVFALIKRDLFALERGSKDFVPGVQGQTFFALRFVHGR